MDRMLPSEGSDVSSILTGNTTQLKVIKLESEKLKVESYKVIKFPPEADKIK